MEIIANDTAELLDIANATEEKVTEIESELDELIEIESRLDDLIETTETILDKVCDIPRCDYTILQSDIPFTITASGVYCLGENVEFNSTGTAITIKADCVTLELHGHAIDGNNITETGIFVDGVSNITITDGIIKHTGSGIRIEHSNGPTQISQLQLSDMFNSNLDDAGIFISSSQHVQVSDCQASHMISCAYEITSTSTYCIFNNCMADDVDLGFLIFNNNSHCIFNNCTSNNATFGFIVDDNSSACIFENCTTNNTTEIGFFISDDSKQCIFKDCVAKKAGDSGFLINTDAQQCTFIGCKAFDCGENLNILAGFTMIGNNNVLESCVAQGNIEDGICIDGNNNTVRNCESVKNGGRGFRIFGDCSDESIQSDPDNQNIFENCVANGNGLDGFTLSTNANNSQLRHNVAIGNTQHGFNIRGNNNLTCECKAQNNGLFGFVDEGNSNRFLSNIACMNTTDDYSAVDTFIRRVLNITYSAADAVSWDNIACSGGLTN